MTATGLVFDIKEFSIHDGPGARVTVFLKGCPMRCRWCHNPEGLNKEPQLLFKKHLCTGCGLCQKNTESEPFRKYGRDPLRCPNGLLTVSGTEYTSDALAEKLLSYAPMLASLNGGITFSGGEPLLQSEFVLEVLKVLRHNGMHTAIETAGFVPEEAFRSAAEQTDLVIMDLKLFDEEKHKEYTCVSNRLILRNAAWLKHSGVAHIFRTPLIPGITDTEDNLEQISRFVKGSRWEKIPYNTLAGAKYPLLGLSYPLEKQ